MINVNHPGWKIWCGRFGSRQVIVDGEKRYWLHVAIDRHTAEVIDQPLEEINEWTAVGFRVRRLPGLFAGAGVDGDPNGIRARVTVVNGRYPRPLDDRVWKSAQYPEPSSCRELQDGPYRAGLLPACADGRPDHARLVTWCATGALHLRPERPPSAPTPIAVSIEALTRIHIDQRAVL
jgi:hypothetical protein